MGLQPQLLDTVLYNLFTSIGWDSLDSCEEPQMLLYCHQIEYRVMLWTISDQLSGLTKLFQHVIASNRDLTTRWHDISGQTLESGRFAGSIDTKQSETLAVVNTKPDALNSEEWLSK